ncbi:2OG-Fe(II) oxygenase [soil metagenome]
MCTIFAAQPFLLDTPEILPYENLAIEVAEKGFAIVDDFLSATEVAAVLEVLDKRRDGDEFHKAGVGSGTDYKQLHNLRGDYIRWIEPQNALPPTQVFLERVTAAMQTLNRVCYLGLKDFETHFTYYPADSRYARHLDQFKADDHRRISFVCYLNTAWKPGDGGELRIFLPKGDGTEDTLDVEPIAGRLVCFRADTVEHEVLTAHKTRYSLTGWMLDQYQELKFL